MIEYKPSSKNGLVYKFRHWNKQEHKNILFENQLYLSSPDDFNDPFDCKLFTDFTKLSPKQIKDHIRVVLTETDKTKRYSDPEFLENLVDVIYNEKASDIQKTQKEFEEIETESQNNCVGILSLSLIWNNILMWSHYADCHRGVCYGFDEFELFKTQSFGKAAKVNYTKKKPVIPLFDYRTEDMLMKISFLKTHSKAIDWEYEQEFRFLTTRLPRIGNRKVFFPQECLREIILGINMSFEYENEIIHAAKKFTKVKIYKALKTKSEFTLKRKLISK